MGISLLLTGCGSKDSNVNKDTGDNEGSQGSVTGEAATQAPAAVDYYGNDISEHLDMIMYVIGDEPAMAGDVEAKINEVLEEKANVTLDINYISLSDYTTKYSLLLASGEDIDIIYSSTWANFFEEAKKDAYMEITEDMISRYMPQTAQSQDKDSYNSVRVNGKTFMIPKNSVYANNAVPVLIRGDLREKYSMDAIDSYDKLEAYLKAVADNEKDSGIYPYAAGTDGVELSIQLFQCKNNLFPSTSLGKYIGYFYNGNNKPTADDMVWEYTTDQYREFVNLAKKWADDGFWSKNAVSNTISPADAFINGTSASVFWNYDTCMTIYNTVMSDHPEWKPEVIDVNPTGAHYKAPFSEGMSVPAIAPHPERSMMVIDLLKWDKEIYDTARYGIEGRSWVATSDTTYQLGAEQGNYTVGNAPITWGLKNDALERIVGEAGDTRSEIYLQLFSDPVAVASTGFTFDNTAVKDKIAAINELCSQYIPILELGLVDDPDATLEEFNKKCEQAGRDDILNEFKKQYTEYLKNVQ
jgi:putative aldouronate transport system substrate-binding protein